MVKSRMPDFIKKLYPFIWIFIAALYLGLVKKYWTLGWDSAIYIESARSLISGNGYSYLGYPQLKYPPGFSLLLSPVVWLWGNNFLLMNLLIVLCALGSLFATYWLFKQLFTREYSILITALTALSYFMVEQSTYIMSDVPYMLFSLLALVYINSYLRSEKYYKYGVMAGILIVISAFLRTVGVSIFLGFLIYLCLVKNIRIKSKKAVLILLLVIIPLSAWNIRNQTVKIDLYDPIWQLTEFIPYHYEFMRAEYDEPMSEKVNPRIMLFSVAKNTMYYAGQASSLILGQRINVGITEIRSVPMALLLLMGVIALVIVVGFVLSFFSRKYLFDYYIICYFGMLFLTTAREPRFLVPIIPFILHYFITGIDWLFRRIYTLTIRKYHVHISTFFIIFFICSNLFVDAKIVMSQHRTPFYDETMQNFMNSIYWVKNNTSKESKIISVRAPWAVLFSERWCVSFPWVEDQYIKLDFFNRVKAEYLIISPAPQNFQKYLLPLIGDHPALFQELFNSGEAKVYQINRSLLSEKLDEIIK